MYNTEHIEIWMEFFLNCIQQQRYKYSRSIGLFLNLNNSKSIKVINKKSRSTHLHRIPHGFTYSMNHCCNIQAKKISFPTNISFHMQIYEYFMKIHWPSQNYACFSIWTVYVAYMCFEFWVSGKRHRRRRRKQENMSDCCLHSTHAK